MPNDPNPPTVGDPAPDFTLETGDGHPVRSTDLRTTGHLVLYFTREFT